MSKNNANVNGAKAEAKVNLKTKLKNTYGKAVTFVALNRGKIGFGFGLVVGAAGALAANEVIESHHWKAMPDEADVEVVESIDEIEVSEE